MKKHIKIIGIVLAVMLASIAAIVGLGMLWLATAKDLPVTAKDKSLVVRAEDLAWYYEDFNPATEFETFENVRYIDRCEELTYYYESPSDDEPVIVVTISHDRTKRDANSTYALEWSSQQLGLNLSDGKIDVDEDASFYSAGDRSRFANLTYEGEPFGHMFVAQKGNSVYAFTISGYLLDDPAIWHELFDDRIKNLGKD